jgi:hypothetical protein
MSRSNAASSFGDVKEGLQSGTCFPAVLEVSLAHWKTSLCSGAYLLENDAGQPLRWSTIA